MNEEKENYGALEDHPNYPVGDEIGEIKKRYSQGCYLVNVPGQFLRAYRDIQRLLLFFSEKEKKVEELEAQFNALKELLGEHSIEMIIVKLKAHIKSLEEGIEDWWNAKELMRIATNINEPNHLDKELYKLIK